MVKGRGIRLGILRKIAENKGDCIYGISKSEYRFGIVDDDKKNGFNSSTTHKAIHAFIENGLVVMRDTKKEPEIK